MNEAVCGIIDEGHVGQGGDEFAYSSNALQYLSRAEASLPTRLHSRSNSPQVRGSDLLACNEPEKDAVDC